MNDSRDSALPDSSTTLDYYEEPLPDGVRFVLPQRRLLKLRLLGWALIFAGLVGLSFLTTWMAMPTMWGWQLVQQGEWFGWGLCAFGMLGVVGFGKCLKLMLFGVAVLANRTSSQIEIQRHRMRLQERFFGMRWNRKIKLPAAKFEKLTVAPARLPDSQVDDTFTGQWMGTFSDAIYATVEGKKPVVIAPCYPRALLDRLAVALTSYLPRAQVTAAPIVDKSLPTAEVDRQPREHVKPQPSNSNIQIETRVGGTTYRVPAVGVGGSKNLLGFAICWNVIVFLFVCAFLVVLWREPSPGMGWGLLLLVPFVAVGIATMLAVVNLATRKTAIVTAGGNVMVISEGIFGKKSRTWSPNELAYARVGPSGLTVNHVPVLELQFYARGGKFGVLSERSDEELEWLADQINAELGLYREANAPADLDERYSLATAASK